MIVLGAGLVLSRSPASPDLYLSQVLNGLLLPPVLVFVFCSSTGPTSWGST